MQVVSDTAAMLTLATFFGGWEIVLILAVVLILFGARRLPELGQGFRRGLFEFRKASKDMADDIDEGATQAGRSVGGIYGKPALQALTPDNQVAERYHLKNQDQEPPRALQAGMRLWSWIRRIAQAIRQLPPFACLAGTLSAAFISFC
jgi:sec-independent protein translocase protein TatA